MNKELKEKLIELFDEEELEIVEKGDWTQDYKYQFRTDIAEYEGKFYAFHMSRSGSPFTDWEYGDTEVNEVTKREKVVTITEWVAT